MHKSKTNTKINRKGCKSLLLTLPNKDFKSLPHGTKDQLLRVSFCMIVYKVLVYNAIILVLGCGTLFMPRKRILKIGYYDIHIY